MFRAQIKGKYSLAPYTVHFPIYVKSFLQEIRFSALIIPRSSRQAQETRSQSHFYNACLVPVQIPSGLNDSLADARH